MENKEKDFYNQLNYLSKIIINNDDWFSLNEKLFDLLSRYFLNNSLQRTNFCLYIENENKIIGVLLAYLNVFDLHDLTIKKFSSENILILEEIKKNTFNEKEKEIVNLELGIEEYYKNNIWNNSKNLNKSEILFFAVDSNYQGKGIGKKLIMSFENECRNLNIKNYYLFTTNHCNVSFYEKNKMTITQTFRFNKDLDLYIFEKNLF